LDLKWPNHFRLFVYVYGIWKFRYPTKKLGKKLKFGQEINQVAFKVNVFKNGIKFKK